MYPCNDVLLQVRLQLNAELESVKKVYEEEARERQSVLGRFRDQINEPLL